MFKILAINKSEGVIHTQDNVEEKDLEQIKGIISALTQCEIITVFRSNGIHVSQEYAEGLRNKITVQA